MTYEDLQEHPVHIGDIFQTVDGIYWLIENILPSGDCVAFQLNTETVYTLSVEDLEGAQVTGKVAAIVAKHEASAE